MNTFIRHKMTNGKTERQTDTDKNSV